MLLSGKSASFELEKSMITKLKAECGSNFTAKLEGMFKDMELSREVMVQYIAQGKKNTSLKDDGERKGDIDCQFQVLTTGFWPTPDDAALKLPTELAIYRDK